MPGPNVGYATLSIIPSARGFGRHLDGELGPALGRADGQIRGATSRWGGHFSSFARTASLGIAGLAVGGIVLGGSFLRAAEESQQVARQTDAVLQSMRATSWTTADAVEALSTRLSNRTGIDDELIQSGQNVLLTFGAVQNRVGEGNAIFDRATEAALNMSTALGTDMTQASMQIGRALNDPVRGLAALRRSGVQFTAQQEEQIRTMVEAGDVAGAQRVMLEELERQFGGSAEAQATASQRLSTMWGNLQEDLGERLLPVAERFADWASEHLPPALAIASRWLDRVGTAVSNIATLVRIHWPRIQATITTALDRVRSVVATVVGYVMGAWRTFGDDIIRVATGAWTIIRNVIEGTLRVVAGIVNVVMGLIRGDWGKAWDGVKQIASGFWQALRGIVLGGLNIIRGIIGAALQTVASLFSGIWQNIQNAVGSGLGAVRDTVVRIWDGIVGFVTGIPGRIASAASGMWDGIKDAFRGALNFIIDAWNRLEFSIPGFNPPGPGSFPGFTLGVPDIPRLAAGAIVRATPGGILANIGEGRFDEAVVPLDGAQHGIGGTTVVEFRADSRHLLRWLREAVRSQGGGNVQVALGKAS